MIFPTDEQINHSKTWTELYKNLGINPRNSSACKAVQADVRARFPNCHLNRYRNTGKFTDDEFSELVKNSNSIREVIISGGWKMAGGSYNMIHVRIKRLGLSIDHMNAKQVAKRTPRIRRDIQDYLTENCFVIGSHDLKIRLIKEGIKVHQCEICGVTEWMGRPTPICLDHINGNHHDNRIFNLRILCPNCHAQTETFSGKNRRKPRNKCTQCDEPVKTNRQVTCGSRACVSKQHSKTRSSNDQTSKSKRKRIEGSCLGCGSPKNKTAKYCSYECASKASRKIDWDAVDLIEELKTKNFLQLSRELGVSDNAIRKQLKKVVGVVGIEPTV